MKISDWKGLRAILLDPLNSLCLFIPSSNFWKLKLLGMACEIRSLSVNLKINKVCNYIQLGNFVMSRRFANTVFQCYHICLIELAVNIYLFDAWQYDEA